jgi:transposase
VKTTDPSERRCEGVAQEVAVSFRELTMIEVREVVRRWREKQGLREIARETGLDRKTVRRYALVLEELGVARDVELDDALVHEVGKRVQGRAEHEPSVERVQLMEHRDRIEQWLRAKKPLRLTKVHVLLQRDHGLDVSYATLRRFAMDELGWGMRKPTVLVADAPPGEEAQVDFGLMDTMYDPQTDGMRRLYALVVTLCFSRYQFVWPTWEQTTVAVCEGLDEAWRFFGGSVPRIIPDNASSMVSRADPLSPTIVDAFADYAQARGLFIDAARVQSPKDKGRVENQVAYVRESWFAGERFADLQAAREHARQWCREIAGARIHGTTRAVPRDVFEAEELALLRPAPDDTYDVPNWGVAKVHPDHHIQVLKGLYSVPTRYIGKRVRVRADSRIVRVYLATELIKTHPRVAAGKRSTDPNDYPQEVRGYAMRSVDGLLARAKERGEHVGIFAQRLLGGPLPWTTMRQGYALVRLCDRHGDARVDALCKRALDFEVIDVPRITRMLKLAIAGEERASEDGKLRSLPSATPRFARSSDRFVTRKDGGR